MIQYFSRTQNKFLILKLDQTNRQAFIDAVFPVLRDCYHPSDDIANTLASGGDVRELIEAVVPSSPSLRSGEFAEIATYLVLPSKIGSTPSAWGPKKWRWKEEKNIPIKKTDVVLFQTDCTRPTNTDFVVAAEVKSKATPANSSPLESAISGANSDRIGRLAKTLIWFKDRAVKEHDDHLKQVVERFIFSDRLPNTPYIKYFKAVLFVDSSLETSEIAKNYGDDSIYRDLEIIVVSIPNLVDLYNQVYNLACSDHSEFT